MLSKCVGPIAKLFYLVLFYSRLLKGMMNYFDKAGSNAMKYQENVSAIRVVKAYAREKSMNRKSFHGK